MAEKKTTLTKYSGIQIDPQPNPIRRVSSSPRLNLKQRKLTGSPSQSSMIIGPGTESSGPVVTIEHEKRPEARLFRAHSLFT